MSTLPVVETQTPPEAQRETAREALFLAQLKMIESIVAFVCHRRFLRAAEAEDFCQAVKLRLIENNYDVFARFQERSSLRTYLTTVIERIYLDFQIRRWGKWRPSAKARRLGPVALRLEALRYRDRLSFDEACEAIRSDPKPVRSREELHALWVALPPRASRSMALRIASAPPDSRPSELERAEQDVLAERIEGTLRQALSRLPAQDFLVLRLHFEDGFSVADIARALDVGQKALYRQMAKVLKLLRRSLEANEVSRADFKELLCRLDWDLFSNARRHGES
jgi:RNA polymerase sigma factor (sigma-70 family)